MEGAFHGGDRQGAQPLSSFLSLIPSISTNVRNLGKFGVMFHTEKTFDFQRLCDNVLSELAQLCGSILTELLGSFLVFFSKTQFSCATCPSLILRTLMRSCRSGQRELLAVPFLSMVTYKNALDLIYLFRTSGFCLL